VSGGGFAHDIAGGQGNLIITSLQSPNFESGVQGWQVAKDGSAEFNDLTIRGTFNGTDFEINSAGIFLYDGTPGSGNLIGSWTSAAGTDEHGNAYPAGLTVGEDTMPQALLSTTGTGGQGAALQFLLNTPDAVIPPLLIGQVANAGAANQFLQLLLQGPSGTGGNGNQFNIIFNSDSDDGTIPAELIIYDQNQIPFLALLNQGTPAMYIGESPGGNSAFIPVVVNGAFLTYSSSSGGQVVQTFTRSGTWTCPTGVTSAKVECWAAGGGGQWASGAGGGGGEYAAEPANTVVPGDVYTVTVGAGGSKGTSSHGAGGNGGNSSFSGPGATTVTAHGGPGSTSNSTSGGTGSTNTTHFNGGSSHASSTGSGQGGAGGGGSAGSGGAGGAGQSNSGAAPGAGGTSNDSGGGGAGGGWGGSSPTTGGNGTSPGGGGGTGGASSSGGANGGVGGNGQVRITYTQPGTTSIQSSLSSAAGTDASGNTYPAGYMGQAVAVKPGSSPSTAEVPHQATLTNSWIGSGSGVNGLWYWLTPENEVRIVADLNSPGTASVIATLPAGYRPATSGGINIPVSRYDDAGTAHVNVSTAGAITMQTVVGSGKSVFINASVPLAAL
jgi:hypothetical protein